MHKRALRGQPGGQGGPQAGRPHRGHRRRHGHQVERRAGEQAPEGAGQHAAQAHGGAPLCERQREDLHHHAREDKGEPRALLWRDAWQPGLHQHHHLQRAHGRAGEGRRRGLAA